MTLGRTTVVPIENEMVETLPEWPLMLVQESVDRVSRSYSTGTKPGHVGSPALHRCRRRADRVAGVNRNGFVRRPGVRGSIQARTGYTQQQVLTAND